VLGRLGKFDPLPPVPVPVVAVVIPFVLVDPEETGATSRPRKFDPLPPVPVPVVVVVTPFVLVDPEETGAVPQSGHTIVARSPPVTLSICRSLSGLAAVATPANSGNTKSPHTAVLMSINAFLRTNRKLNILSGWRKGKIPSLRVISCEFSEDLGESKIAETSQAGAIVVGDEGEEVGVAFGMVAKAAMVGGAILRDAVEMLTEAPVEALDHVVGLRAKGADQAVNDRVPGADAIKGVIAGRLVVRLALFVDG
jgi:hypothetical protein